MNDMRQTSFPGRKPLPTGETALRQKSGLAWVSILLVLCLVAGMLPVFSQGTQVGAEATYSDHTISTVTNMEGVTVNLFDYWVKNSQNGADGYRNTNEGINFNKELRFGSRTNDDQNYPGLTGNGLTINGFNGKIIEGIVEENLGGDGYPIIAEEKRFLNTSDHSLSYLFNPNDISMENYRNTYENATGLFRIDDEGYYYYNANENYAEYDIDDNRFYVYNTWGVENNSQDTTDGQFFPFDPADEVFSSSRNNSISQNGIDCTNSSLNHYFGFTLEAEFLQPANGNITIGDNSQPMTFEFSGDDDVWVFVDGVLVLDLGGIHNKAEGSINFATGEVITKSNVDNNNNDKGEQRTTILKCFQNAGKSTEVGFKGNTFADNTYHTLSFFYLERGATASNMMLKFNLDTRPVNQIVKMDETGTPIEGITYELYEATVDVDGTYKQRNNTVLATLTTDEDGYATFLDREGKPFEFNNDAEFELGTDGQYHFILKEIDVPSGYRSTGDIWLRFDPQTGSGGQLLVSNKWQTGAIANYSFVGTENSLDWANDRKPDNDQTVDDIMKSGTMFAVVLMKDTDGNWVPLYGNNRNGWQIQEPSDRSEANSVVSAVIEAAKQQNINHDGVICEQNVEGQWEVTLNELPGDITQYYYANMADPNSAKYIVAFYATSARSLNSAMANNTWLIDTSSFERKFSANIWIPNIRNMFQVQKLDQDGNPMTSGNVSYALYESQPTWNAQTSQWEGADGAPLTAYDTVTVQITDANSVAVFGLDGNSNSKAPLNTDKTYYLVETSAPTGYVPSTQVVTIVVDDTGVHADAGVENDDVTVAVGAGYLLKPMEKFGANDAIDATLHDIKGVVQTGTLDGTSGTSITWNEVSDTSGSTELHLQYGITGRLLQYGPYNEGDDPYLTYDSGFGRLYIEQCMTHNKGTHKDNIETAIGNDEYYAVNGITPLFTGSTTVQIKNHPEIQTGDVTVTKTVTGLQNLNQDTFSFTIQFAVPSGSGVTMPNTVNYTINSSDNTATVEKSETSGTVTVGDDNSIAFTLKNGGSVTFVGLPEGLQYTITENLGEDSNLKYTYSSSITAKDKNDQDVTDTDSGDGNTAFSNRVPAEDSVTVTYTNTATPVSFNFTKVDGSNNNAELSGAGFTLYRWDGTGDATGLVNTETPGANWEVVTGLNADALFEFDNLYPDATYRLVETTTPGGYIAPGGQWQLTYVGVGIKDSYNGWTIELITEDGALNKAPAFGIDDSTSTLYLPNYQVPEIPVTGGEGGGWMFYGLTGTLLVGGAVLTLFAFSRRRKHF